MRGWLGCLAIGAVLWVGNAFAGGSTAPGIVQSGTITPGNCAQFSANGVAIDAGATCGTGTSGVSQVQGTSGQILINGNSAAHTGATTFTLPNSVIIGTASTATGTLGLNGITSGTVTIQPQQAAGTFNYNLPITAGTAGQVQTSGGGGSSPMTWTSVGTSGAVIPLLSTANTWTLGQTFSAAPTLGSITGSTQCLQVNSSGVIAGTGSACGNGSGTVTSVATSGGVTGGTITSTGTITLTNVSATAHQWADSVVSNSLHFSQPACADISNAGTVCAQNTGTSGAAVPLLNGANTWSATQTFATIAGYLANVTTQAGTTYTLTSTDCGTLIRTTSNSAVTVTAPNNLAVGCEVAIAQIGAGQVTVSAAAGATVASAHSFTKTFGQSAMIGLAIDANSGGAAAHYIFSGDGA